MFSKLNALALACAVALGATHAGAQSTLQFSPLFSTQGYDFTVSGGVPKQPFWVGIDTMLGTTVIKPNLTVGLAITPNMVVLPTMLFGSNGSTTVPMAMPSADLTGQRFYAQAVNIDPTSARYYASNIESMLVHPARAPSGTGEVLSLSMADDQVDVVTAQYMGFQFFGQNYVDFMVSSNGRVLFESTNTLSLESAQDWLDESPAVALFWDDLDPSMQGTIEVAEETNGAWLQVRFSGVPQFGFSDSSSATATFFPGGTVMIEYGSVSLQDGLAGITPGNSVSSATPVDLNAQDNLAGTANEALYELFDGSSSNFDLSGSVLTFLHLGGGQYSTILD